jgi:hypothetical protein
VQAPSTSGRILDAENRERVGLASAQLPRYGVPVAYLLFEGEQHGFRRAENIRRAPDTELSFYGQVLGFALPTDEGIEPVVVVVENL